MTSPGPGPPGPASGPIRLRLALAFVAVALAAVALLAGLTAAFAAADVSQLGRQQGLLLSRAVAVAAGAAWERTDSWAGADLSPVLDLATRVGAQTQLRDRGGRIIAATPGFSGRSANPQFTEPVVVRGERVGSAAVRLSGRGLDGADQALLTALLRAIGGAAGLAALLALGTGLVLARRITRPVGRLIDVTRSMGRGDRAARVGQVHAPGELRELAAAFDQMADALDREDQLRRALIADVAHELRTPIAVLQAGHEALVDGVTEPTPEELASLREEVLRLGRMVGDLQTLASADAAALHLTRTRCDLAEVAASAADSLASQFETADLTLQRRLTPVIVTGDPGRLHQIITNLLTNALKFTPAGGQVTIETMPAEAQVRLQVTDTGCGIPADELPRIFDRFWRGRQAGRVAGSGIGLTIAAELARAHGGRLDAASEPGKGTQITLTLPATGAGTVRAVGTHA